MCVLIWFGFVVHFLSQSVSGTLGSYVVIVGFALGLCVCVRSVANVDSRASWLEIELKKARHCDIILQNTLLMRRGFYSVSL